MITRRQIFERFTRADLLEIARHFDLKGLGGLSKGNIVTKLARKRSIELEMVLSILYRSFLKSLCLELGLGSSGSKQVLIDRILGQENKPKQIATKKQAPIQPKELVKKPKIISSEKLA